jgi:DNA-binding transcriptional LysR family regulator
MKSLSLMRDYSISSSQVRLRVRFGSSSAGTLFRNTNVILFSVSVIKAYSSEISASDKQGYGRYLRWGRIMVANQSLGPLTAAFLLEVTTNAGFVDSRDTDVDIVIRANPRPDHHLAGRCFPRIAPVHVAPLGLSHPHDDGHASHQDFPEVSGFRIPWIREHFELAREWRSLVTPGSYSGNRLPSQCENGRLPSCDQKHPVIW